MSRSGDKGGGGFGLPGGAKLRLLRQWSLQGRLLDHRKVGSKGGGPGIHGVVVDGIFNEGVNCVDCFWLVFVPIKVIHSQSSAEDPFRGFKGNNTGVVVCNSSGCGSYRGSQRGGISRSGGGRSIET